MKLVGLISGVGPSRPNLYIYLVTLWECSGGALGAAPGTLRAALGNLLGSRFFPNRVIFWLVLLDLG